MGQKGQTLIEMLVALVVGIVIVSSVTVVVISAVANSQFGKNQNLATAYAQETMEEIRKLRDANWSTFNSLNGIYCVSKTDLIPRSSNLGQCTAVNIDQTFMRQVRVLSAGSTLCPNNAAAKAVVVSVKWTDSKCPASGDTIQDFYCHKAELINCFNNIFALPTP